MVTLKKIIRKFTGPLIMGIILLLGLSGISGKYQDKREETLTIENHVLRIENISLKNGIKFLKKEIQILKLDTALLAFEIVNIKPRIDTVIIPEKKIYVELQLTGEESLAIGRDLEKQLLLRKLKEYHGIGVKNGVLDPH